MSDNLLKLIARILLAVLFVVSGFGKLTDPSAVAGMLSSLKLPGATALTYLVGLGEVVGGVAIIIGYRLRAIAPLLAAWCIVTGLIVHLSMPIDLMKNLGLAGGLLLLATTGAGSFALERRARPVTA
ncbi:MULTISPECIES: DoxX family protein [unclassified Sphingomonas]|jgi:putative oxidoreductase|nr:MULTISPECIES: DoxX family protein [unclassified Sphingomonas]